MQPQDLDLDFYSSVPLIGFQRAFMFRFVPDRTDEKR
jgi:hypothetical protein